jgi:hypothetical protein
MVLRPSWEAASHSATEQFPSIMCSQEPSNYPYLERDELSAHHPILFLLRTILILYSVKFVSVYLFNDSFSIETVQHWMNCKGSGRKRSWHNWGTILAFVWRDWRKPRQPSFGIVGVPSEIRIAELLVQPESVMRGYSPEVVEVAITSRVN